MMVVVAKIGAPFGIRGWVHLYSFTEPAESLLEYDDWHHSLPNDEWAPIKVLEIRPHGDAFVAAFEGVTDRDSAARMTNLLIAIPRVNLPELPQGEFYWADLEGFSVITTDGKPLGVISYLFETGANDVMVVVGERQRLLPFIQDQVIKHVDTEKRVMTVDWDPEF